MRLSEAIASMQEILNESGDLELVSGLDRTGWGEPALSFDVRDAFVLDENGDVSDKSEPVADIILSESSSHSN